ncbi:MAG: S8 family serine peptidase [Crocinitomicaceae bacterium]
MKKMYLKRLMLSLSAVFLAFSVSAQTIYQDYVDGKVWVKVNPTALFKQTIDFGGTTNFDRYNLTLKDAPFLKDLAEEVNFTKIERPFAHVTDEGLNRIYRLTFADPTQVDFIINELSRLESVEYAEKMELLKTTLTPDDTDFNPGDQWSLFQINATSAWNLSTGDANIVVAIVDDAVDIAHVDLTGSIWTNSGEIANNGIDDDGNGYVDDVSGYDVADMDNNPGPGVPVSSYTHGTHVAGIAGATTNNTAGVASIGFGISLMAVKSTNSGTSVTNGYDGVVYAVNSGANVINMSWGGSGSSSTGQSIINYAANNNIICVAAAGNDNVSSTFYPAGYNNVISVASTTTGDAKSSFSNYGSWIDISAPGSGIWSTVPNNGYAIKQGTSMASPLVAGLCGLMLSLNPGLLPSDVETCLLSTADNISAANPGYPGQLGAGRINAFEAMNCIATTLSLSPVADFTADITSIIEGQSVNFTDLSYYNPTTWSWTFSGGTPSTFTGANPPAIVYNTAGTYDVTLTVTNGNGSDTETKTSYITVNGVNGCDTIDNMEAGDLIYTYSYTSSGGYLGGHNNQNITDWAEKFSGYGGGGIAVTGADFYFTEGQTQSTSSVLTLYVWDANGGGGAPGTVLHTQDIPMTEIQFNAAGPGNGQFYITQVDFTSPVTVNTDFFVGFTVTGGPTTDTVCVAMCENFGSGGTNNATRPNTLWAKWLGTWSAYSSLSTTSKFSSHIYPHITDAPLNANITSNSPVCDGDFMDFDASGSTNAVSWDWAINGTGTPYPTGSQPSVIMDQSGNHWAYMQIFNYCGFSLIDSIQVQVDATPAIAITTTADTICPGNSVDLTASGATSYTWNPGALSGANQTVSPTATTTYNVQGTTGSCSGDANVTIVVDDAPPTALYTISNDTVCVGGYPLSANGGLSSNAATYAWTFTGGDITSSTLPNPQVNYATTGTYTFTLTVENTCAQTDDTTGTIIVVSMDNCPYAGIQEGATEIGTVSYLDQLNDIIYVQFGAAINGDVTFELVSTTGQIVYRNNTNDIAEQAIYEIPVSGLLPAMYLLRISTNDKQAVEKFFIK